MWLIAGLGNPGRRYKWSRHNIGYQVVEKLACKKSIKLTKNRKAKALEGKIRIIDNDILLIKPLTYMNRSGVSISWYQGFYKIDISNILVVIDDMDLPWLKLRLRAKGSSGGHKGLQAIIDNLGSAQFPRLRMGIGRSKTGSNGAVEHVLGRFSKGEQEQIGQFCDKAVDAVYSIMEQGVCETMNRFNG